MIKDITGHKFGRLAAIKFEYRKGKREADYYWSFLCDCGKKKIIRRTNVMSGGTQSCGCLAMERNKAGLPRRTHGMKHTRFYRIWEGILRRCNNPNQKNYPIYGGRGIKVIWESFEEFRDSMLNSYERHIKSFGEKQTTIDRIDNNGNYSKENCRWASHKEQGQNTRSNRIIEFNGESKCLGEWSDSMGIKYETLFARITRYNWPIEMALTKE